MAANEEQKEELEVLHSIYEDDNAFKQISDTCIQYKIGEDDESHSFVVEFVWPLKYPHCLPDINLNAFYNNRILPSVKDHIVDSMKTQAECLIGEAMTFTLIDWAKENLKELMGDQPANLYKPAETEETISAKKKEKKEHLTKAQKRRLGDKFGVTGERPRGWNWVDPIKHLSQTGKASERQET